MYDDGPDELAKRRVEKLVKLGLIKEDAAIPPPVGILGKEWSDLTPEERALSARKMEAFAAMVDVIDQNVGRMLDHLKSTGELDNTFVLFMSDNGAEGATLEALPVGNQMLILRTRAYSH
jgi:arylsulfatase A-like enzyme